MKTKKPEQKKSLFRRIVNIFIGILTAILIVIVLFFGFSQTSTFRNLLRENIVEIANNSLNGELSIGKIDGSIFTSLILRDIKLDGKDENILTAEKIDIKISPLQLLVKRIYFRSIELSNINLSILEDENGLTNLSKLSKATADTTVDDTTAAAEESSPFPFSVQINNLSLNNINLVKQSYENLGSSKTYPYLNLDDFKLNNFNLSAKVLLHSEENIYQLVFDDFSGRTNISDFEINNLSGTFEITNRYANVKRLNINTDRSDISISAFLGQIDLLGDIDLENFQKYPLHLELEATPFTFDDLSVFLAGTRILYGSPSVKLKANGQFGNFDVERLIVDYDRTHIDLSGRLENLHTPDKLFMDVEIRNSSADYLTARRLLPDLNIPQFENLFVSNMNIDFRGEPTVFHAKLDATVGDGYLETDSYMDVQDDVLRYDINFETKNLDLTNIVDVPTTLTSKGKVQGVGLTPKELDAELDISINNSHYKNLLIDSLKLETYARSEIIEFYLDGNINYSNTELEGIVDFSLPKAPEYEIKGNLDNFNLAMLLEKPELFTDLNFKLNAEGKDLDIDKMTGEFIVDLAPSYFRDKFIDSTSLSLLLEREGNQRSIKLLSDFVDLNMGGEFSLKHAINILGYESETVTEIISNKIDEFNPLVADTLQIATTEDRAIPEFIDSSLTIDFDFEFNDFELIAIILQEDKLDISGAGTGQIKSSPENFSISTDINLDYLVKRKDEDLLYLSEFELGFNFSRDNRTNSFEKLFGTVTATGNRMYFGNNITNITADLIFNANKLFYNLYSEMEPDLKAEAEGTFEMSPDQQIFNLNTLWVDYKNIEWENDDPVKIEFYSDSTKLTNLNLSNENALLKADGFLLGDGRQEITMSIENLPGRVLDSYVLNNTGGNLESEVYLQSNISGTLDEPEVDLDINVNNVLVSGVNFGNLICDFNYIDKNISADVNFINSEFGLNNPLLTLKGNFPIYLGFADVEKRIVEDENLNITFKSTNFNISTFGNLLPFINNQSGFLKADVELSGTFQDLNYSGYLAMPETEFNVSANNLDYSGDILFNFNGNEVEVTKFNIANKSGSPYYGAMNGTGSFLLKGMQLDQFNMTLNGDLAVLSKKSKGVSPSLYGSLVIASEGDWNIKRTKDETSINGKVILKDTDISFIPLVGTYKRSDNEFVYNILVDSSKIDKEEIKFKRLVSQEAIAEVFVPTDRSDDFNFNYDITLSIEDEAKFSFIFAKAVNQGLTAIANGQMKFESKDGQSSAQGAFTLMEGSKLEFFKALEAEGTLRFESDLTNPYMDILASYTGEYDEYPNNEENEPEEVAVKIKLIGPVSEIANNLTEESGNIKVYRGGRNIENNIADSQFDAADAIVFLMLNIFKKDLTSSNRGLLANEVAANTATSLLGPVLTNLVNSELGDIVNNIQLSRSGQYTKFKVSGRYQKFRYSFGGTDQVFQDIQNANLKIELLLTPKFLLKVERKDPYISYSSSSDFTNKINEFGLKYRFEF